MVLLQTSIVNFTEPSYDYRNDAFAKEKVQLSLTLVALTITQTKIMNIMVYGHLNVFGEHT